ncbi:MAG: hypothetical protein ACD_22C00045G0004 [uncultured bacterium]|nr:MAG: hypothetical protein ACD_22C00045G0004 [uncultured bacterium]
MWSQSQRKYCQSSKGKIARKKYQESEKGRAARVAYMARRKARKAETKPVEAVVIAPVEKSEEKAKIKASPKSKKE